jgi:hypothetical protein
MGQKLAGHATALIIANTESEAADYAPRELAFVKVITTILVSDCVYAV